MVASVSSSQSGLLNGPKQATTSRGDKVSLATLNQLAWVMAARILRSQRARPKVSQTLLRKKTMSKIGCKAFINF
jgi:hypothetical protein